jgi:hypothetical protein
MSKFDKFEIKTLFEQSHIQEKQDIIIPIMKLIQKSPIHLHMSMRSISNDNTLTELREELANLEKQLVEHDNKRLKTVESYYDYNNYNKIDTKFKMPTRDELAKYNQKYKLTDFIPTKK